MAASDDLLEQAAGIRENKSPTTLEQGKASDALLDGIVTEQKRRTDTVLDVVTKLNPDKAAEANKLSKQFGLDVTTVEKNQEEIARLSRIKDTQNLMQASPFLARQMTDPVFASIAHDDVQNISDIERAIRVIGTTGRSLGRFVGDIPAAAYGVAEGVTGAFAPLLDPLAGTILPENPLRRISAGFGDFRKKSTAAGDIIQGAIPKDAGWVERDIYNAGTSFGQNLPGLGMTLLTKNPAYALGSAGTIAGGQSVGKALDEGTSPIRALTLGATDATAEVFYERFGVNKLLGDVAAKSGFGKILFGQIVREVPSEMATTLHQNFNEWALLNPEKSVGQFVEELGPAERDTVLTTVLQTVMTAGLGAGVSRLQRRGQSAQSADQSARIIEQLNQLATTSKVIGRDAESVEQFVNAITEDSPAQNVYIDAKVLMQSGLGGELAKVSPSVAAQIDSAIVSGGEVRIPIAEYTARIAPTEFAQSLIDDIRVEGEDFTRRQAQEYMQSGSAEELQQEVERTLAEKQGDETFKQSAAVVKSRILEELNGIGRFNASKNEADATLYSAYYAVRAAQLGVTPEALLDRRRVNFAAEAIGGQQFDQPNNSNTGPFGPIFVEHHHDAQGAIAKLIQEKTGEAIGALHHPDIGDIDLVWGEAGSGASDGYGLAKLAKWHPEVLGDLQNIVSEMQVTSRSENRVNLESADHKAGVRLTWDGQAKHWLLTAFRKGGGSDADTRTDTAGLGDGGDTARSLVASDSIVDQKINDFQQGTEGGRGSFNPESLTITLLKGADLSTALHEGAHFFFENDITMAAELQREVNSFGLDSLKPGEQQILNDVSELFKWHGILGDTNSQFSQWYNLSFEEKRAHHERTAEAFENYLYEGKAPSLELQPYFQKFRAWLANVYKSLKDFIAKNPEAGKLNDDVRGVFDRMLATTEQIALAEQGRSMMPLFSSPEQVGMTPEEFAAYQALGVDASNEAIQELQARGLRDMQWLHNAHGRIVKGLQKESEAKRREVQMEVRREVMSQPVYRAWAFLTGKISTDDKIEAVQRPKSDPNEVDETQDSLFVAIAKLGGLNKDQVIGEWGTDAKDKPASGLFGKPVWRVNGGLTLDGMVEALSQHGYLTLDEHGKADIRKLEEKFSEELRGNTQHSNAYEHSNDVEIRAGDQVANPQALAAGRFDIAELDAMGLPVEVVNVVKAHRMTAKIGLHPDIVAEQFDFASGDELLRTLAASDKPADVIEGMTDQRMLERYGDLSSQQAIEKAADKAIHSDARARMVATEVNALAKATGGRKMLASAAKEFASMMVARLKVRNIKPGQYANAEVRAAKAADKAIKAGDLATAAAEKRNQIINVYATRAAYDAQEQVEGLRRKWSELANRADDKLVKAYDMDLVNAVRAILGEYGIAEKKAKKASEYLVTLQNHDPEMYAIVQSSINAAESSAKPFKEMTVEEVRGLADEIDAILHLARRSRQMEIDGDLLDRQDVEDALRERMEEIGIPLTVPGDDHAITKGEERMLNFKTALAAATRVESWVGKMDGEAPMGPFRRFIWSRIKDSADAYRTDKAKYLKQFRDLFDTIAPTMKPGLISAPELGYTFGKDSGGSAINEIVHAILHTGNESNKRKLLLGRNWAQERADGSIDTSRWDAFIVRMAAEGKISKAHFDFAQGVWDLLDSTKPLAQKTHRDVFGKYFDEVTASPVPTPFGVYAGGYVPAMADSRIVTDAKLRALSEQENAGMAYAFPTTPKGFTKARVEYNRPLMLDLRTLAQHIDKVLLFSYMEMPVRDVRRVLSKVGGTLDRIDSGALGGMLNPWLARSAQQQVVTPMIADGGMSRFFSTLRSRAGAAAMFGNLANAAQQITGFSLAAVKVKPRLLLSVTADYMKHPRKFVEAVADASPYMAERLQSEVAAMSDDINAILLNPSLIEQGQAWTMRHAYFLQTAVDSVMSPIVWTAAYNQALEQGLDHKDAVRLGNSAVRETQGSSLPEDISRVESGDAFVRLFTQFAGYFNMQANLVGTEFSKLMQAYGLRQGAGRGIYVLLFGFLAPAVVGELVIQLFRGGPGDDDKDGEYLDDWLAALFGWAPLRTATAMIPVGGSVINAAANAWNGKPYDDRMATSPAISMLESAAKAPVSAYNAIVNEGSAQKAVRDVATLISMTVGLPANIAARPIGYLSGVADDKIDPTGPVDAIRGTLTGVASPESKR